MAKLTLTFKDGSEASVDLDGYSEEDFQQLEKSFRENAAPFPDAETFMAVLREVLEEPK